MVLQKLLLLGFIIQAFSLPDFLHTSEEVDSKIERMLRDCHQANKRVLSNNPYIYKLQFESSNSNSRDALIIFGEHSREMISVETSLELVQKLCHNKEQEVRNVRNEYNLHIIVNMNPGSRKYVENGHYCLRENQNGVDLNRNYDIGWRQVIDHHTQCSSGNFPFSEVETQSVRDILNKIHPQVFISIHSGTKAILFPYAYKHGECEDDRLSKIAHSVANKYCEDCQVGSAAKTIGYMAFGSSQDYAYDKAGVPFSFTFEIYQPKQDMLLNQKHLKHHHEHKNIHNKEPISNFKAFLEVKDKTNYSPNYYDSLCLHYFNPLNEKEYHETTQKWSLAILYTLNLVTKHSQ